MRTLFLYANKESSYENNKHALPIKKVSVAFDIPKDVSLP